MDTDSNVEVARGKGMGVDGDLICGDRRWFDRSWWAHSATYRSSVVEMHTGSLYDLINQCHPNKFN